MPKGRGGMSSFRLLRLLVGGFVREGRMEVFSCLEEVACAIQNPMISRRSDRAMVWSSILSKIQRMDLGVFDRKFVPL